LRNPLIAKPEGSNFRVTKDLKIEFLSITIPSRKASSSRCIPRRGCSVYANDFKLDKFPVLGSEPNWKRLSELGKLGVKGAIIDTLYSNKPVKTPSERVAKEMLRDVLIGTTTHGRAIILTTFASHIARLKTVVDFAKQLERKPVFLGRSLAKYLRAARSVGLGEFAQDSLVLTYKSQVERFLKKLRDPTPYLFIVTGHQGEPKAMLSRLAHEGQFPFRYGDMVHLLVRGHPDPDEHQEPQDPRERSRGKTCRLFTDIHVSGHASKEDHRELLEILRRAMSSLRTERPGSQEDSSIWPGKWATRQPRSIFSHQESEARFRNRMARRSASARS